MSETPRLPQHANMPKIRKATLEQAQKMYEYNHSYLPPLAMADKLPLNQYPNLKWIGLVVEQALRVAANNRAQDQEDETAQSKLKLIAKIQAGMSLGSDHLESLIGDINRLLVDVNADGVGDALAQYNDQFNTIDLPDIAADFNTDDTFAFLRVAGPNPRMIRRLTQPHPRFPITQEGFASVPKFQHDTLQAAMDEGRLYLADYQILAQNTPGVVPAQKYNYAPMALFALPPGEGPRDLKVVAIQCGQTPAADNPIFHPGDGMSWEMAKTCVNCADGNVHEAVTHLGRTHLTIEPFVIATHRQLHHKHPLFILLEPHFVGTLFINKAARKQLLSEGGVVDELLSGTLAASIETAVVGIKSVSFNDLALPDFMADRGLTDPNLIYPYRDDAMEIWDAIHNWVQAYLEIWYSDEETLRNDHELQAWAVELASGSGGRVANFGESGGGITSLAYLVRAVTTIIFTAGPQHAAVNFPQSFIMSYTPAMPLAGYAPAPSHKNHTEKDWLDMFPPLNMACTQLTFGQLLGGIYFTQLGEYGHNHFEDERVKQPLAAYRAALAAIEERINQRNLNRRPYRMLLPSKIPRGINI